MSRLSLQAVLELTDRISRPLREIQERARGLSNQFREQQDALRRLNQAQANISSFRRLNDALGRTRNELQAAQNRAQELARAHAATANPTRAMTRELERARNAVRQLREQERDQIRQTQRLRQSLTEAGIDTRNLSEAERRLRQQIESTNESLRRRREMLERVNRAQRRFANDMQRINKLQSAAMSTGMAAVAGGTAMVVPIKFAMDFESAMADVKKVVDFDTPEEFKQMNEEVLRLSKNYPMAAEGIAAIVAAGGQSGIAKNELTKFAEDAIKMGVAFDITADEAGQSMAEMRVAFKMSQDEVRYLGDQINLLGNNTPQASKKILEITQRVGPLANLANITAGEVAALGSSMVGLEPDVAATAIKKVINSMTAGAAAPKSMRNAYKELGLDVEQVSKDIQKNAPETIQTVLKAIRELPKDKQVANLSAIFGLEGIGGTSQLADNLDNVIKNLQLVSDETKVAGSMQAEYDARAATSANNWQIFKNKLAATSITIGTTLLPAVNQILEKVGNLTERFQTWASQHPVLVSNIGKVAAVIITLLAAFSAISMIIVTLLGPMAMLRLTFTTLGAKGFGIISIFSKLGSALKALFIIARAHPIIALFSTLAILAYTVYKNWAPIKQFFIDIFNQLNTVFTNNPILNFIFPFIGIPLLIIRNWSTITGFMATLWENIKTFASSGIANISATIVNWSPLGLFYQAFAQVLNWFGIELPSTFTGFGTMLLEGLGNGITNAIGGVVEKAKNAAAQVTAAVKSTFGINSPSRVFTQFGIYNMQGLANGINNAAGLPQQAMLSASQGVLAGFDTSALNPFEHQNFSFDNRSPLQTNRATATASAPAQHIFNIYAAPGMDEKALAQLVAQEVAKAQRTQEAATRRSYSDLS